MAITFQNEYERDFYAWALHNAKLMRQRRMTEIDFEHIAEEIESIGKKNRRELINHFAMLLAHLLKWQQQSEKCDNSWKYKIKTQRFEVIEFLKESPSLEQELEIHIDYAYKRAILLAVKETGLNQKIFPSTCPFSLKQALDPDFFPNSD